MAAGDHDPVRAAVLAPEAGHQVRQVPASAPPLLPQQRGAAASVQVTNYSTAFSHVTTVLTSDWPAVPARQAPRLHGQLPRHGGHAGEY